MAEHTPTPWMANRAGELAPNDWMIVADRGVVDGIQQISTVARALSIRQTAEVTAANAALIVRAVNSHSDLTDCLVEFLEPYHDQDCPTLFAKLPGTEAQRVVRARKVLKSLGIDTTSFDQLEGA